MAQKFQLRDYAGYVHVLRAAQRPRRGALGRVGYGRHRRIGHHRRRYPPHPQHVGIDNVSGSGSGRPTISERAGYELVNLSRSAVVGGRATHISRGDSDCSSGPLAPARSTRLTAASTSGTSRPTSRS